MEPRTAPDRAAVRADLLAASAFSAVLFSANVGYWTAPTNDYYLRGEDREALLSCLAAMALVASVVYAVLRGLRRHPRWAKLALPLALFATLFALDRLRVAIGLAMPGSSTGRAAVVLTPIVAAFFLAQRPNAGRLLHTGFRWTSLLTALFVLTLARAWIVRPSVAPERTSDKATHKPLIVWAVFDELDEGWLFEHRPSDLKLPAFDALAARSLVFRQAKRPGPETLYSLPALTLGQEVVSSTVANRNDLDLTLSDGRQTRWSQADSVFDTMQSLGYAPAIVGFYHNYPGVFGAKVPQVATGIYPVTGFWATFEEQFLLLLPGKAREWVPERLGSASFGNREAASHHRERLGAQTALLGRVLRTRSADFVFFHCRVPHAPFFRPTADGKSEVVTSLEGYLDNLRAADATLGTLMRTMRERGDWDEATLLVTSDHNLRWSLRGQPLNDLVPLILKLPHQRGSLRVDDPVRSTDERWLLEAVARGEIRTPQEASGFLVSKAREGRSPTASGNSD